MSVEIVSNNRRGIIELVKKLPEEHQRAVREALSFSAVEPSPSRRRKLERHFDGIFFNDDPAFEIVEQVEAERHLTARPPSPDFE